MNDKDDLRNTETNNDTNQDQSSLYSFNYRDKSQHTATHQGDYDAKRDSVMGTETEAGTNKTPYGNANSTADDTVHSYNSQPYESGQPYGNNQTSDWNQQNRSYYNPQNGDVYHSQSQEQKAKKSRRTSNRKKGGFAKALGKCVVFAVVFGLVAGGVFQGVTHIGGNNAASSTNAGSQTSTALTTSNGTIDPTAVSTAVTVTDVSDIVDNVMPAIVSITSMSQIEYYNMFGQSQSYEGESAGSGIIVAEDNANLYIVTNNHVVEGSTSLTISFVDDQTASATVKGTDASTDLAVVSVAKDAMPADTLANIKIATLGDSDSLRVGESAVAIGNALGYGQSVTTGVISALNREVTTTDSTSGTSVTNELIQTDAAINPGNSGGALLNMNGEVIGINSVKYSDTSVEGMGYAIPITTAQPIINELITREKVSEAKSAYLGITGVDVTTELSQAYNMPEGIFVASVAEGSAAEKAGIKKGDIIISFDDKEVSSMEALKDLLQYYEAGQTVDIVITYAERDNYVQETVSVTLGSKVE